MWHAACHRDVWNRKSAPGILGRAQNLHSHNLILSEVFQQTRDRNSLGGVDLYVLCRSNCFCFIRSISYSNAILMLLSPRQKIWDAFDNTFGRVFRCTTQSRSAHTNQVVLSQLAVSVSCAYRLSSHQVFEPLLSDQRGIVALFISLGGSPDGLGEAPAELSLGLP